MALLTTEYICKPASGCQPVRVPTHAEVLTTYYFQLHTFTLLLHIYRTPSNATCWPNACTPPPAPSLTYPGCSTLSSNTTSMSSLTPPLAICWMAASISSWVASKTPNTPPAAAQPFTPAACSPPAISCCRMLTRGALPPSVTHGCCANKHKHESSNRGSTQHGKRHKSGQRQHPVILWAAHTPLHMSQKRPYQTT